MRKVYGPLRAAPQYPGIAKRRPGVTVRRVAAAGGATVLAILYWLIFYQNLPGNFGLNGTPQEGPDSFGHVLNKNLKVCMIVVSLYFIATRWALVRQFVKDVNVGVGVYVGLVALSAVWSIDQNATISGCMTLLSTLLTCFAISLAGWQRQRFQQLTVPPLMFILGLSLVVGLISPQGIIEIGLDISQKDAWHGITLTKNQFGMTASLGVIICAHRWLAQEGRSYWSIAGAALAALCLMLSRSNTSEFATLISVLFMALVMRVPVMRRRYTTFVVIAIAATMLLYELVIQNVLPGAYTLLAPIRILTGKDSTFSARTIIWDILKQHIQAAPYLGTGYGAYWVGEVERSPSYIYIYLMHFYPTEAHNGYLDVVNDLGYAGLVCLLVFLAAYIRQALQLMKVDRNQAALYLGLLYQEMVMNMSESDWFQRSSTFAVLALAVFCLSRQVFEMRASGQTAGSASR
jgi:exopolysaccharide production protein ExoQ